jgi:phage terminase small subunit
MAGIPGKGGQKGRSGGIRPGAGRKPKEPAVTDETDMLQLLKDIATGKVEASPTQVKAAVAAVAYTHAKVGEGGKKEQRQAEAEATASGKFGARQPPKLVASR